MPSVFVCPAQEETVIEKVLDGQNQYTDPLYVPSGTQASFQITQDTAPLIARVSLQFFPDPAGINLPNVADARWANVDTFDQTSTPTTKTGQGNMGWFRVGIATGDYVSGKAAVSVWHSR